MRSKMDSENSSRYRLSASLSRVIIIAQILLIGCSDESKNSPPLPQPPPVTGEPTQQTGPCQAVTLPSGQALEYCTQRSTQSELPDNVVYFFHGLGGSASDLFEEPFSTILRLGLERLGAKMPHFVSLSYGPQGIIPADTSGTAASKAGELIHFALPRIEQELGYSFLPPKRQLMGGSMGGFNSLTVAASQPDKFKSVISLCPAVIAFDPFNPAEVDAYVGRHQPYLRRDLLDQALILLKANFPAPLDWQRSDPIQLLRAGRYDGLAIFMSVGKQDQYGYIEGARSFADQAQAQGVNITWRPVDGPHCVFETHAMIEFLKANL